MDDIKLAAKEMPDSIDDQFMDEVMPPLLKRASCNAFSNLADNLFTMGTFNIKLFSFYKILDLYAQTR
ncbi:MAG: hypothetical protein LBM19_00210 [Holosporales bacterium]|jgi:hypothetical protein|nr:hypothetical protein [Holosporales bacterium]